MRKAIATLVLAAALSAGGAAQAAEEWGLPAEEVVRFEAQVVDILCELTGDCPAECGGGARQLGLVDDAGVLILPLKNMTPFSGAVAELIDFCGQRVVADGLFSTNRGYRIFALHFVRAAPDGKWRRANRFLDKWAAKQGVDVKSKTARQWFRNDPVVMRLIAEQGKLGLGPAADEKYLSGQ